MSKDRKKDIRLIKPTEDIDRGALDRATDALRTAIAPSELDMADHEALIAMTLGEDVSDIADDERSAAQALRLALEGQGESALSQLAMALRWADQVTRLQPQDNEALLAMTIGDDAAAFDDSELAAAEKLRTTIDDDTLVASLRATRDIESIDNEALLALTVGHEDLPAAPAGTHRQWRRALRNAHAPSALEGADSEVLLAVTLGDDFAAIGDDELSQASELRHALHAGKLDHPLATLAQSIRATAGKLRDIDELNHERILRSILFAGNRSRDPRHGEPARRGAVVAAIVAIAAAVALFAGSWQWLESKQGPSASNTQPQPQQIDLVVSRSTAHLFDPTTPFPAKGGETERVSRIVQARQADLRKNRFASWGVR